MRGVVCGCGAALQLQVASCKQTRSGAAGMIECVLGTRSTYRTHTNCGYHKSMHLLCLCWGCARCRCSIAACCFWCFGVRGCVAAACCMQTCSKADDMIGCRLVCGDWNQGHLRAAQQWRAAREHVCAVCCAGAEPGLQLWSQVSACIVTV
jgi:hypothetical protein